jgi:DNA/RNA endonuclease YhcR with UshA esterase domain
MYDMTGMVTVSGVVKEFQYTNPHSWLIVTITNEDGTTTDWAFEAEAPSTMMRGRIGRNAFPVGEAVTVSGRPMRDGRPAASWVETTMSDGTVVRLGGAR